MTTLRGIDFGPVWGASGIQGFFGEGYRHHEWTKHIGGTMSGMTFVAKTCTLHAIQGNMPLTRDFTPREFVPKCIVVKPWQGVALNKVGLSNPGAFRLLSEHKWDQRTEPFFLSFLPMGADAKARIANVEQYATMLRHYAYGFKAPIGLQLNYSCPNADHGDNSVDEIVKTLEYVRTILPNVPLVPKLDLTFTVEQMRTVLRSSACDALCFSNTLRWGSEGADWKKLFGSLESPLADLGAPGGGGLSGAPLFPLVLQRLRELRRDGSSKHLNVGGGVMSVHDVELLMREGASSVYLGSVSFLRPWRVQKMINKALELR